LFSDFGYEEDDGNIECIPSDEYDVPYGIPYPCPSGTQYYFTVGYRKIFGDKCVGGQEQDFLPRNRTCPGNTAIQVHPYNFILLLKILINMFSTIQ